MKKIVMLLGIIVALPSLEARHFLSEEDLSRFATGYLPIRNEQGHFLEYSFMGPVFEDYSSTLSFVIDKILTFNPQDFKDNQALLTQQLFTTELLKGGLKALSNPKFDRSLLADFLLHHINSFKSFIAYLVKFSTHIEDETQRLSPLLPLKAFRMCYHHNYKALSPMLSQEIATLQQSTQQLKDKTAATLLKLETEQLKKLHNYLEHSLGDDKTAITLLKDLDIISEKQTSLIKTLLPGLLPLAVMGGIVYKDSIQDMAAALAMRLSDIWQNSDITLDSAKNLVSNIDFNAIGQNLAQKATNFWESAAPIRTWATTPIGELVDFAALGNQASQLGSQASQYLSSLGQKAEQLLPGRGIISQLANKALDSKVIQQALNNPTVQYALQNPTKTLVPAGFVAGAVVPPVIYGATRTKSNKPSDVSSTKSNKPSDVSSPSHPKAGLANLSRQSPSTSYNFAQHATSKLPDETPQAPQFLDKDGNETSSPDEAVTLRTFQGEHHDISQFTSDQKQKLLKQNQGYSNLLHALQQQKDKKDKYDQQENAKRAEEMARIKKYWDEHPEELDALLARSAVK